MTQEQVADVLGLEQENGMWVNIVRDEEGNKLTWCDYSEEVTELAKAFLEAQKNTWEKAKAIVKEKLDVSDDAVGWYEDSIIRTIDDEIESLK